MKPRWPNLSPSYLGQRLTCQADPLDFSINYHIPKKANQKGLVFLWALCNAAEQRSRLHDRAVRRCAHSLQHAQPRAVQRPACRRPAQRRKSPGGAAGTDRMQPPTAPMLLPSDRAHDARARPQASQAKRCTCRHGRMSTSRSSVRFGRTGPRFCRLAVLAAHRPSTAPSWTLT